MSNLNEPMLPANEAMREIEEHFDPLEAMIAWEVPRIVAEPEAVKAVLKEYAVRLMFEGSGWGLKIAEFYTDAIKAAVREYQSSKIIKESEAPF